MQEDKGEDSSAEMLQVLGPIEGGLSLHLVHRADDLEPSPTSKSCSLSLSIRPWSKRHVLSSEGKYPVLFRSKGARFNHCQFYDKRYPFRTQQTLPSREIQRDENMVLQNTWDDNRRRCFTNIGRITRSCPCCLDARRRSDLTQARERSVDSVELNVIVCDCISQLKLALRSHVVQ